MATRAALLLLLLLAGARSSLALAQELPARTEDPGIAQVVRASRTDSGFACTRATLVSGAQCVFEGSAGRSPRAKPARVNAAFVEGAEALCGEAVRPSPKQEPHRDLVGACRQTLAAVLEECNPGGKATLVDPAGRFTEDSRGCYLALRRAVEGIQRGATCCWCALELECARSASSCLRAAAWDVPELPACAAKECHDACSQILPLARTNAELGSTATAVPGPGPEGTACSVVVGGDQQTVLEAGEPGSGTFLVWQRMVAPTEVTYREAQAACEGLRLGGHDDWRLPSAGELRTLLRPGPAPTIDAAKFPCTPPGPFWTLSSHEGRPGMFEVVHFGGTVNVGYGSSYGDSATSRNHVRCVRTRWDPVSPSVAPAPDAHQPGPWRSPWDVTPCPYGG